MTRILILHGWMHSIDRYKRLKRDLEDLLPETEVVLWKFAGFGGCQGEASIQAYIDSVCAYLMSNKVDVIIGHSMGAMVALQATQDCDYYGKLVLISPPYGGLCKFRFLLPIASVVPLLLRLAQRCVLFKPLIWLSMLLTVNSPSKIDALLWKDFYRADINRASVVFFEIVSGNWGLSRHLVNETTLIIGDSDRIISYLGIKTLVKRFDDVKLHVLPNTGHTPIIESYDKLSLLLCNSVS